jgi:hypothetical protein
MVPKGALEGSLGICMFTSPYLENLSDKSQPITQSTVMPECQSAWTCGF